LRFSRGIGLREKFLVEILRDANGASLRMTTFRLMMGRRSPQGLSGAEFAGRGRLEDVGAVEGVALLGAEAGFGDDAAEF
jgi:hypothetical protein